MAAKAGRDIEIFTEAVQLPTGERRAFLDRECAADETLRRKIESLLKSNDRAGAFLEHPLSSTLGGGRLKSGGIEKPGDHIGHFKLLAQIGEGGCGTVFLSEQEEPVRRRVALKVIKPGMDTKSVIARFEAERQALAMMDHPNIARVYDAGATESGRPYFVMEFVDGLKITDFCDRHSLSVEDRLQLFVQVCAAIQHAHHKGIIHRDIKPSNILVTAGTDGKPVPKVIDFGIAKAISGQLLTDKTLFTAREMLIGTPAYMSPEQAALTGGDVDARSDIYSLGVLLYELLTGSTPFDTSVVLQAGLDEFRRVIREREPARPSTRLSAMVEADLTTISHHRGVESPKLIRDVRGDLDWIVMRTMEKDPARRYATANGLAMDVERYLMGEAILARPPSTVYKARKLISRNKLLASSMALIFMLLAAGLVVTTRLLLLERHTREQLQYQEEVYRLEGLGIALCSQRSLAQISEGAANLQKAFKIRRENLGGKPPDALVAACFTYALEAEKKSNYVGLLSAEFPDADLLSIPGYASLYNTLLQGEVEKGAWPEAAYTARAVLLHQPDDYHSYHSIAPLLAEIRDIPEYRALCRAIVLRFHDTHDPFVADQMAKDCLILPSSGADLKEVGAMADIAITQGTNSSSFTYFQCCKALAEYRMEHFGMAAEWANPACKSPYDYCKAESLAVLSMARFQLGRTNEAQAALNACAKLIDEKLPKLPGTKLGNDWRDWIIAHCLYDEASGLINGVSTPDAAFQPRLAALGSTTPR